MLDKDEKYIVIKILKHLHAPIVLMANPNGWTKLNEQDKIPDSELLKKKNN